MVLSCDYVLSCQITQKVIFFCFCWLQKVHGPLQGFAQVGFSFPGHPEKKTRGLEGLSRLDGFCRL